MLDKGKGGAGEGSFHSSFWSRVYLSRLFEHDVYIHSVPGSMCEHDVYIHSVPGSMCVCMCIYDWMGVRYIILYIVLYRGNYFYLQALGLGKRSGSTHPH